MACVGKKEASVRAIAILVAVYAAACATDTPSLEASEDAGATPAAQEGGAPAADAGPWPRFPPSSFCIDAMTIGTCFGKDARLLLRNDGGFWLTGSFGRTDAVLRFPEPSGDAGSWSPWPYSLFWKERSCISQTCPTQCRYDVEAQGDIARLGPGEMEGAFDAGTSAPSFDDGGCAPKVITGYFRLQTQ